MRSLPDVGGYSAVFVPGPSPRFVVKTSKSHPHAIPFRGQASHLSSLHTEKCRNGFVYVDDKVRSCVFPLFFHKYTKSSFPRLTPLSHLRDLCDSVVYQKTSTSTSCGRCARFTSANKSMLSYTRHLIIYMCSELIRSLTLNSLMIVKFIQNGGRKGLASNHRSKLVQSNYCSRMDGPLYLGKLAASA